MEFTRIKKENEGQKHGVYIQGKSMYEEGKKRSESALYTTEPGVPIRVVTGVAGKVEKAGGSGSSKQSESPVATPFSQDLPQRHRGGFLLPVLSLLFVFFASYFSGITPPGYVENAFVSSVNFLREEYASAYEKIAGEGEGEKDFSSDYQEVYEEDFISLDASSQGSYFADMLSEKEDVSTEALQVVSRNLSPGSDRIFVNNETGLSPDLTALSVASYPISATTAQEGPVVLIIHTHGTECYSDSAGAGEVRCDDTEKNVVRVGRELSEVLNSFGIPTLHSKTMHDKASYITAYSSSARQVKELLRLHPSIKYVIDLHRDAVPDIDSTRIKPCVSVCGQDTAQIMLVMGTNYAGGDHSGYLDNLTVASHIQARLNALYPGLARPINLRSATFNQQLLPGSMLLEVGSDGNTLEEALRAVRLFGRAFAQTVLMGT